MEIGIHAPTYQNHSATQNGTTKYMTVNYWPSYGHSWIGFTSDQTTRT